MHLLSIDSRIWLEIIWKIISYGVLNYSQKKEQENATDATLLHAVSESKAKQAKWKKQATNKYLVNTSNK